MIYILINYSIRNLKLIINLQKIKLIKTCDEYKATFEVSKFIKQIAEQLNTGDEVITVYPDTVVLFYSDLYSKKVPVKLNLFISYDTQFGLYNQIIFKPDSINISGTKNLIENISYINTEFKPLTKLKRNEYLTVKLINPSTSDKVNINPNKVTVFIPVEKFTEGRLTVPIAFINNNSGKTIKTFPDKVEITYLVALPDYNKVSTSTLSACVDCLDAQNTENNKIQVRLLNKPDFIQVTQIKPDRVEFILW